jgi:predicted Zn-dependent peptidase
MRNDLVDEDELDTVKNYMIGKLMRGVDGPMKYSDVLKGQLLYGREPAYLNQYLKTIQTTSAEEVRDLAVKYLNFDQMYKVTVGSGGIAHIRRHTDSIGESMDILHIQIDNFMYFALH